MSWKCSCMKKGMLLHKWFQPIVYCVLPDVIIFLAISGTEYWKAINLCQHLLILITWQVFGNLNLLETNITVFYFQSVSNEINSACWFFIEFGVHIIFMYFQLAAEKKTSFLTGISLHSFIKALVGIFFLEHHWNRSRFNKQEVLNFETLEYLKE